MIAGLLSYPKLKVEDDDGNPLSGGKLYSYEAGTSTPKATYSDSLFTVPNTNPVILDARGEAVVFMTGNYKLILTDPDDVTIWSMDNIEDIQSLWAGDVAALEAEVAALETDVAALGAVAVALEADITALEEDVDSINTALDGIVSHTLPAFFAYNSTYRNDVTGDNTIYQVPFDEISLNQGGGFGSPLLHGFTAPQAGNYQFNVSVHANSLSGGAIPIGDVRLEITGKTFVAELPTFLSSVIDQYEFHLSVLTPMNLHDTAYVNIKINKGSKSIDVYGGSTSYLVTYFSGSLVPNNYLTRT